MLRRAVDSLAKHHLPAAEDLLARAFDEDPFFHFLFEPAARRTMVGAVMRSSCELALAYGQARAVLDPDLAAVCLWWRPGTHPPSDRATVFHRGRAIARAATSGHLKVQPLLRALRTGELIEEMLPDAPHFYLMVLAVEPGRQGRGIGSRILREILAEADEASLPAYLETSKPSNLKLYRRHGFEVTRTLYLEGGPPMWSMRREPA